MKLHDLIQKLSEIDKKYANLDVIYSSDAEGNSFDEVYYSPTVGFFNKKHKEFLNEIPEDEKANAVCIN